jgi:hypothetical protein
MIKKYKLHESQKTVAYKMDCGLAVAKQKHFLVSRINSNPTLPPHAVVLQLKPSHDLNSLGKDRFDFHLFNRVGGLIGMDHPVITFK